MTTQPLNADTLPHADGARIVTAIISAFAGFGRFVRSIDQARAAAEASRDLYSLSADALAKRGLTRTEVPDYVVRTLKLGVFGNNTPANDDTKIAA